MVALEVAARATTVLKMAKSHSEPWLAVTDCTNTFKSCSFSRKMSSCRVIGRHNKAYNNREPTELAVLNSNRFLPQLPLATPPYLVRVVCEHGNTGSGVYRSQPRHYQLNSLNFLLIRPR